MLQQAVALHYQQLEVQQIPVVVVVAEHTTLTVPPQADQVLLLSNTNAHNLD
jgi:DhnA family fructose-bisphosphate aldolase class Ia